MTATVSSYLGGDAVHSGAQRRSPAALIRGGTIVNHDSSRRADVLVQDGVIAAIGANLDAAAPIEVIDAGGCFILPGGIDPHTHLEFGFMERSRPTISNGVPRPRCRVAPPR
jgi:cytosine/adenosine deaminase-related metal-dependent hydrolase